MELPLFSRALGKQCYVMKAGAGPETLLQARLTCSTGTLQSGAGWKTAGSLGLGGFWVMAGAAVLQIWGTDAGGFMASWEHTVLKVWALLKPFLLKSTVGKAPCMGVSALWPHQDE